MGSKPVKAVVAVAVLIGAGVLAVYLFWPPAPGLDRLIGAWKGAISSGGPQATLKVGKYSFTVNVGMYYAEYRVRRFELNGDRFRVVVERKKHGGPAEYRGVFLGPDKVMIHVGAGALPLVFLRQKEPPVR